MDDHAGRKYTCRSRQEMGNNEISWSDLSEASYSALKVST